MDNCRVCGLEHDSVLCPDLFLAWIYYLDFAHKFGIHDDSEEWVLSRLRSYLNSMTSLGGEEISELISGFILAQDEEDERLRKDPEHYVRRTRQSQT